MDTLPILSILTWTPAVAAVSKWRMARAASL
jgi:hypothetical protein